MLFLKLERQNGKNQTYLITKSRRFWQGGTLGRAKKHRHTFLMLQNLLISLFSVLKRNMPKAI
jgi:hypothetical protein